MRLNTKLMTAAVLAAAVCAPAAAAVQQASSVQPLSGLSAGAWIGQTDRRAEVPFVTDPRAEVPFVTDPRAEVPLITDTLGGNGEPRKSAAAVRAPKGPQTDGSLINAAMTKAAKRATAKREPRTARVGEGFSLGVPLRYQARTGEAARPSDGFDWGDAGIGAGIAVGTLALMRACLSLARQLDALADTDPHAFWGRGRPL